MGVGLVLWHYRYSNNQSCLLDLPLIDLTLKLSPLEFRPLETRRVKGPH